MVEASIIIPTYNRSEQLRACLEALRRQTQPPGDYEVVVVVDGSTDNTLEMLASLKPPYNLRVVSQPNRGQAAALNRGAEEAVGRILIFIDDDLQASPTLIAEHLRLHRQQSQVVGVGQIRLTAPPGADWFTRYYARDWDEQYRRFNEGGERPGWEDCYGGNMSLERAVYREIGGNDAGLARSFDVDLAYRLARQGIEFVYLPGAAGSIIEPKDFSALAVDLERNGSHYVELCRRYPEMLPSLIGFYPNYKLSWTLLWRFLLYLNIQPSRLEHTAGLFGKRLDSPNWYRFLERYCFWRGVRQAAPDPQFWQALTYGTPILLYHAFGAPGEPASRYVIPIQRFSRQMAWLHRMGYRVLSLDEYLDHRRNYRLPPARSVVITIDDGYRDNKTLAYPVLHRYGFPATVFLVSGQIGGAYLSDVKSELDTRPMLTWGEIREMAQGGVTFGAHTRTHPNLLEIPLDQAREEICSSKVELENALGAPVHTFSYPFGEYDSSLQEIVQQAGFYGSCLIDEGLNTASTGLHSLRRVEIYGTDTLLDFALSVRFGERREAVWKHFTMLASELKSHVVPKYRLKTAI